MSSRVLMAAGVSVAVHAAMILPMKLLGPRAEVPAVQAANAELIRVDVEVKPSPLAEGARRAGEGPAEPHLRSLAPAHPKVELEVAPSPASVDVANAPDEEAPVEEAPVEEAPVEEAPSTSPAPSSAPSGHLLPPGEGSAEVERELHARLEANAARCYPGASRRFHESGVSEVAFCVDDTGRLAGGKLSRTSGSERLDRAAVDCVIGEVEAFPAAHGRCFSLPVKFGN